MSNNQNGTINATLLDDTTSASRMAAYDRLPAHIRKILREGSHNYIPLVHDAEAIANDPKQVVLLRHSIQEIERSSAILTYGEDYPVDLIGVRA